jgi:threonine/homoserine/homoserine lactone efflux protein
MSAETLGLLILACLAVNLSPGPSVLLVTSVGAARGFRAGLFAVLGMTAGAFLHVLLAASGAAALLATAPPVFAIIQYLGAAYLIYLGLGLLRSRPNAAGGGYRGGTGAWQYFRRGLLVDALNPKIALFFLAFIPQFLNSVENPGFLASIALGSVFLLTGAIVNSAFAFLAALGASRASGRFGEWLRCRIPGGVLIFLGLRLLWRNA